jgi:hypothetical protein
MKGFIAPRPRRYGYIRGIQIDNAFRCDSVRLHSNTELLTAAI